MQKLFLYPVFLVLSQSPGVLVSIRSTGVLVIIIILSFILKNSCSGHNNRNIDKNFLKNKERMTHTERCFSNTDSTCCVLVYQICGVTLVVLWCSFRYHLKDMNLRVYVRIKTLISGITCHLRSLTNLYSAGSRPRS